MSPHVQHFLNSIPMSAFYNHKAIHQPYVMRKVCGLSYASVGKINSHSTQNRRGTAVLYKDINIHLNGQGTVPLSSLTSFAIQESVYSLEKELHVSDALVAQNCNVVGIGDYISYSQDSEVCYFLCMCIVPFVSLFVTDILW